MHKCVLISEVLYKQKVGYKVVYKEVCVLITKKYGPFCVLITETRRKYNVVRRRWHVIDISLISLPSLFFPLSLFPLAIDT